MKKIFQFLFSAILIYLAFSKIHVGNLFTRLLNVPIILIVFTFVYGFLASMISSWRWSIILLKKPKLNDISAFVKCHYLGAFYGLVLPTSLASDLVKWLPLIKKYPNLSKTKIAGSVLIDRIVGASAFFPVALISAIIGKILNFNFPNYLWFVFVFGCIGVIVFYLVLYFLDFEKIGVKSKFIQRIFNIMDILKNENKKTLLKVFLISLVVQIVSIFPVWITSLFLNVNFSLISVYVFIPIISLILLLPISIAGFGAREQLYLFFFSQIGVSQEGILLVSTYSSIMGVLIAFVSGLFLITFQFIFDLRKNRVVN
jgi:hypothetical protein